MPHGHMWQWKCLCLLPQLWPPLQSDIKTCTCFVSFLKALLRIQICAVQIWCMVVPGSANERLSDVKRWITFTFTWAYMLTQARLS